MRKIKNGMGAKTVSWIGITISGILFLGSVVGAYVMEDAGVYHTTEKEMRKQIYQSVAEHYSVIVLDNMKNPGNDKFSNTNFRYGIIKADNIENLDLNDESMYVERNFTQEVTSDMLYQVAYEVGANTQFSYAGNLFGNYSVSNQEHTYQISEQVYGVCYDVTEGIFYFETSGDLYPIQHVELMIQYDDGGSTIYEFDYDFGEKMYENMRVEQVTASASEITSDRNVPEIMENPDTETAEWNTRKELTIKKLEKYQGKERLDKILNQKYITFDMFEGTEGDCERWTWVRLNGTEYYNDGTITFYYNSEDLEYNRKISEETSYYLMEEDILCISHTDKNDTERYYVVSILPENLEDTDNRDMFVQAYTVIRLAYSLRYSIFVIMIAAFAVMMFLVFCLIHMAGRRKDSEEIVMTWLDKIPLDFYLIMACAAEIALCVIFLTSLDGLSGSLVLGACAAVVSVLGIFWLGLLTLLTVAVRVKSGTWMKNTILFRILDKIRKVFWVLIKNIPVLGKAAIILLILFVWDFFSMVLVIKQGELGVLLWLIQKMAVCVLVFKSILQMKALKEGGEKIAEGDLGYRIDAENMFWEFKKHAENLNGINTGMSKAVEERMKSERFKTELITNVSHDIKTPLTSLINYVDLLEKEKIENETVKEYLGVLKRQSARLKKLIEDLMEASKASTGNLAVSLERLEAGVSMVQIIGEFEEKTVANGLELLVTKPERPIYILADSRHFWRVIDNLMNNICKYAQPTTRVYINLEEVEDGVLITFRNTSKYALNISSGELMERFVRGDSARTTEGNGLGLSIARSLMELMGGKFELYVDGDLFKVVLKFSRYI